MEKLEYKKPSAEIVRFENEDIITSSGGCTNPSHQKGDAAGCDHGNHSHQW